MRTFILDGEKHDVGAHQCGCNRKCPKCGGLQHWQPVYGGYWELCETCDANEVEKQVEAYEWALERKR